MSQRIEPRLQPAEPEAAGESGLRIDPSLRVGQPAPLPEEPRRRSILDWVFGSVLACIVLLLLTIVALRWLPPPTSSYMLQSPVKPVQYRWVPSSAIADTMRRAVVAAEDQKFRSHHGFDVEAIRRAQEYNRNPRHRRRGASTISQQTAKNMFLWPGGYVRKAIEAALTVLIEKIWGKDRILEVYLNIAEFGPGIYGVEAAAQNDFGKPASLLTADEAARLAAVLPNPRHWSVRSPSAYVQSRSAWILGQMGYGAPSALQEEPEPPASEMPETSDMDEAPPDAGAEPEHDGAGPAAVPASPSPPPDGSSGGPSPN